MSHNNEPNSTKERGEWCNRMKRLSLEDQHHLPPLSMTATMEVGKWEGGGSELTAGQKASGREWASCPPQRPYQPSVDSGFNSSSGSGSSDRSGGSGGSSGKSGPKRKEAAIKEVCNDYLLAQPFRRQSPQCPDASYMVEGPMEYEWEQKKVPKMLTLVPADCDRNCDEWIVAVKERLLNYFPEPQRLDMLRELFTNGKEAWWKVATGKWAEVKEVLGITELDNETFLRLLSAIVSLEEIRMQLNLSPEWAYRIYSLCSGIIAGGEEFLGDSVDLKDFWDYNNKDSDN